MTLPPLPRAAAAGLQFRPEGEADQPFLTALYRSTREQELDRTSWDEPQKDAFIGLQHKAQRRHYREHYPDALWLIIVTGGQPAGRLYLERWSRELRIIDIALTPQTRGRGLGTVILQDLQDEATAAGTAIGIHVEKENPAMALYRRLGFKKTEDKGVYDLMHWQPPA